MVDTKIHDKRQESPQKTAGYEKAHIRQTALHFIDKEVAQQPLF
jgi:hypothetical protein